ncbi:MAG: 5-formyltetrahydrofolate cyclo-ligase [Myxococcota bacterium]
MLVCSDGINHVATNKGHCCHIIEWNSPDSLDLSMSDNQSKTQRPTDAAARKAALRRRTKAWLARHAARQRGPQGELALCHVVDLIDRRERWRECITDPVAQEKMTAVALFVSLCDEIDLNPLHHWLTQRGIERWVPRGGAEFCRDAVNRVSTSEGSKHLPCHPEPVLSVNEERAKDLPDPRIPKHCGLLLVPGLAFDRRGNRLGRGQGYYDRLLRHLYKSPRRSLTVGMCLREQVLDHIPVEPHDQPVDAVCVPGEGVVWRRGFMRSSREVVEKRMMRAHD